MVLSVSENMRRRDFINAIVATATAWPTAARAQQPSPAPLIGILIIRTPDPSELAALRQGLADAGYVGGRNVAIEVRTAKGQVDRVPRLVAELVQRRPAVIIAGGVTSAMALKTATTEIPVIFLAADDPVKFGLVASLSRPGGNATGVNLLTSELTTKRLDLVRQLLPKTKTIAVLVNPRTPEADPQLRALEPKVHAAGQRFQILSASSPTELDAAFAALKDQRDTALLVTNDPLFRDRRNQLIALAARNAIPTVYDRRAYVAAGGLISYGTDYLDGYRNLGVYASKILGGAKPADLPVEQSTKFELVINLKTARTLGLTIPPSLLALADDVID
jgi:putative ABC transport system substrate-binding protein